MFRESFLHFVWQYQYFSKKELRTVDGDSIEISSVGLHNNHEGPDFLQTRISIGGLDWFGNVEIHRLASEWCQHGHDKDPNYENVILHVVWENDRQVSRKDGSLIATLELKGRIKPGLIRRYKSIVESSTPIPCVSSFQTVRPITRLAMLDRVMTIRLEEKSAALIDLLQSNQRDWEMTTYQWLSRGFGFKTNSDSFMTLTEKMPWKILAKHSNSLIQVEALLFGQAGFLEQESDSDYIRKLRKEYFFLRTKYGLKPSMIRAEWTFARVRPSNYPTVRIAQLAAVLNAIPTPFYSFSNVRSYLELSVMFGNHQSSYWSEHYDIGKKSKRKIGGLSKGSVESLIINVTVPLLVALWRDRQEEHFLKTAQSLLMQLTSERNRITDMWKEVGWNVSNAFDSQGLIQLYNDFCSKRRCIECGIGAELVSRSE